MSGEVSISVDATQAIAKFNRLPDSVRRSLRSMLPQTTRKVGAKVDEKLNTGLKSRNRLDTRSELVENPTEIYGRVSVIANADPRMLPTWLEEGTRAHEIVARNARALAFFWDRLGKDVFFQKVQHPGYAGLHYMRDTLNEMRGEITQDLTQAVKDGAKQA